MTEFTNFALCECEFVHPLSIRIPFFLFSDSGFIFCYIEIKSISSRSKLNLIFILCAICSSLIYSFIHSFSCAKLFFPSFFFSTQWASFIHLLCIIITTYLVLCSIAPARRVRINLIVTLDFVFCITCSHCQCVYVCVSLSNIRRPHTIS